MIIMNYFVTEQVSINAYADNKINTIELINERAINELIINGLGDSTFGEIELDDILISVSQNELIIPILYKLITGDLFAMSELRLLVRGIAEEKIQKMADSISH